MTQLTDSVYAVEVPDKGQKFRVQRPYKTAAMCLYYKYGIEEQWNYIKLPPGNWQFICTTKEAFDEEGKRKAEAKDQPIPFGFTYDYLRSLLTSKGLDVRKNYFLLKKM